MVLVASGLNYRKADVSVREQLAFTLEGGSTLARDLVDKQIVTEATVLSTCNRTEFYYVTSEPKKVLEYIVGQSGLTYHLIEPYLYQYIDRDAVAHVMKVASGLDSMIFGESEILGQLRDMYAVAAQHDHIGKQLGRLLQITFSTAKQVRHETGIGENPISVASVAAKLAQHIFSDLAEATVLLVGAGRLIQAIAKHLAAMGVKQILVTSRTDTSAKELACNVKGQYFALHNMPRHLAEADIVITGTTSALPILGKGMLESALQQRKRKPMFVVDLSVPRNVEPEVRKLEDVYLYTIDDLEKTVEENRRSRHNDTDRALKIIDIAVDQFMNWSQAQGSFKTLQIFRHKFDRIRDDSLRESLSRLTVGDDPEIVLHRLAHTLTNRLLHEPTRRLREAGLEGEEELLDMIKDIFELNHEILHTE